MQGCSGKLPFFILLFSLLPETAVQSDPPPRPAYEMDFRVSTYFETGGVHVTDAHMIRHKRLVRFEPKSDEEEIHIFDYEEKIFYRVFPGEKIFFTHPISQMETVRAYQQGIIFDSRQTPLSKNKIKLKETEIQGHPSILYLIGKEIPSSPLKDEEKPGIHYSLVWEAQDLFNMPIKIADRAQDGTTTVIEFLNIKETRPDPSLFSPPDEFLHLSPF